MLSGSSTTLAFPLLHRKSVQVDFDGGNLSSDGGLLLLARLDQEIGLTEQVTACLQDARLPERVKHPLLDLVRQRVYQIVAGYEDCNDANTLRSDPALKVAVGRCPESDPHLASQSTLSRLEGTVAEEECEAINAVLLEQFLSCPRQAPKEVFLDFDPSEDPTHGQQEFSFFNGHYGRYCFLPLFAFARAAGESEEFLVAAELPDGHDKNVEAILARRSLLVAAIRARWLGVKVIFRADAWFATPEIFAWCEENGVAYAIAIAGNAVLKRESEPWREEAARAAAKTPQKRARRFGSFWYRAKGWERARKVVVKAEETGQGPNPRYVVVNDLTGKPRALYQFYGKRGSCENRIKEMKEGIKSDRTSCCEFASNKVRLMLHAVAFVLCQRLRRVARNTGLGRAQVERLRHSVIKIAARVKESTRRVRVELCSSCPSQAVFRVLARRLGIVAA